MAARSAHCEVALKSGFADGGRPTGKIDNSAVESDFVSEEGRFGWGNDETLFC